MPVLREKQNHETFLKLLFGQSYPHAGCQDPLLKNALPKDAFIQRFRGIGGDRNRMQILRLKACDASMLPRQLRPFKSKTFPKIGSTILGVPIKRTIVFWCLYWGPTILGNYQ